MTEPRRVRVDWRRRGGRKPPGVIYVGRPTKWGNPYLVAEHGQAGAVRLYGHHLAAHPELVAAAPAVLGGRDLACWCPLDQPCHADLLLRIANPGLGHDGDLRRLYGLDLDAARLISEVDAALLAVDRHFKGCRHCQPAIGLVPTPMGGWAVSERHEETCPDADRP